MKRVVSVIVPTYGRQRQVDAAIGSVARQSNLLDIGLEVIVVDDASPTPIDVSGRPSTKVIRHDSNRGAAAARNTGVAAATGDVITFLDSDDIWLPDKLAVQMALFERLSQAHNPDLLVVGTGFMIRTEVQAICELGCRWTRLTLLCSPAAAGSLLVPVS